MHIPGWSSADYERYRRTVAGGGCLEALHNTESGNFVVQLPALPWSRAVLSDFVKYLVSRYGEKVLVIAPSRALLDSVLNTVDPDDLTTVTRAEEYEKVSNLSFGAVLVTYADAWPKRVAELLGQVLAHHRNVAVHFEGFLTPNLAQGLLQPAVLRLPFLGLPHLAPDCFVSFAAVERRPQQTAVAEEQLRRLFLKLTDAEVFIPLRREGCNAFDACRQMADTCKHQLWSQAWADVADSEHAGYQAAKEKCRDLVRNAQNVLAGLSTGDRPGVEVERAARVILQWQAECQQKGSDLLPSANLATVPHMPAAAGRIVTEAVAAGARRVLLQSPTPLYASSYESYLRENHRVETLVLDAYELRSETDAYQLPLVVLTCGDFDSSAAGARSSILFDEIVVVTGSGGKANLTSQDLFRSAQRLRVGGQLTVLGRQPLPVSLSVAITDMYRLQVLWAENSALRPDTPFHTLSG
ncbi:hypothetical protein DIPPA_19279 [Diplonema papillatum]|nr:hypothetical protein DIPPA_19279 [Diplonema papillatum]